MVRRRPYRFLFVSAPFSGIEVFFRNLQEVLAVRSDMESTWEWIEFEPSELVARVPLVASNWTLKGGLVGRSRVRCLERASKSFDAALFNHMLPLLFLRGFQRRVPTLLWLDSTPPMVDGFGTLYGKQTMHFGSWTEVLKRRFVRSVYMECARILPWTELVRNSLEQHYNAPAEKLTVLSPGIDLTQWTPPERTKRTVPGHPLNVLFVGGEFLRKGGDVLLNVSRRPEFKECTFHIVTHDVVGPIGPNVRVYADLQPNHEDLKSLYAAADVFLLPTKADFAPTNVICEAMAMRLPVITTAVGGLGDVVRDGETGYVIPAGDADALADRLRRMLFSPDIRKTMGLNGRRLVEERYDLVRNGETIVGYLREAADGVSA